jgi:hypothetical protein
MPASEAGIALAVAATPLPARYWAFALLHLRRPQRRKKACHESLQNCLPPGGVSKIMPPVLRGSCVRRVMLKPLRMGRNGLGWAGVARLRRLGHARRRLAVGGNKL